MTNADSSDQLPADSQEHIVNQSRNSLAVPRSLLETVVVESNDPKDAELVAETEGVPVKLVRNKDKISPDTRVNWLSWMLYSWQTPLMRLGRSRPLQQDDMYRLAPSLESERNCSALENAWRNEVARAELRNDAKGPSMVRVLFKAYGREWLLAGIPGLVSAVAQCCTPLLLKELLSYLTPDPRAPPVEHYAGYGYVLVVGMFLLQVIGTLSNSMFFFESMKVGVRARTGLITALYRKSLKLSARARVEFNAGKVTNIMSTDTNRIDLVTPYLHMLWSCPLQIILVLALLISELGVATLAGFGLMVLFLPINGMVMRKLGGFRLATQKITDSRVKLMNEVLQGVKIIKFFAWEEAFLSNIDSLRGQELVYVRKLAMWRAAINGISIVIPSFAAIIVYVTYSAEGHQLLAPIVFSSLALFNVLRLPLMFVPMVIALSVDARVAANRLGSMLMAEELSSQPVHVTDAPYAIRVTDGSFIWDTEPPEELKAAAGAKDKKSNGKKGRKLAEAEKEKPSTPPSAVAGDEIALGDVTKKAAGTVLQNINLTIPKGQLVAIVGRVGAGKSSLLSGIVGEMRRTSGQVEICGEVGYCPQQPWIQNATLKDNILFGQPFDQERYDRAIFYASLKRDLETLPGGELTEIGEKGINLSGGQKARINLARAIYYNTDIIILDDVLSAVDAHVGSFLFNSTIRNALQGKTRILVTHALHYVPQCDYVILMNHDGIEAMGSYQEMLTAGGTFTEMMAEYGGVKTGDEQSELANGSSSADEKDSDSAHQVYTYEQYVEEQRLKAGAALMASGGEKGQPAADAPDASAGGVGQVLMTAEERATGAVDNRVYAAYARAGGGLMIVVAMAFVLIASQLVRVYNDFWLTWWTAHKFKIPDSEYMGIYFAFGCAQAVMFVINGVQFAVVGVRAARTLHMHALRRVMYSPMSFFDTTPLGRIINRFSRDQDSVDNTLYDSFRMFMTTLANAVATFVVIVYVTYWFAIPLVPLLCLYYYAQLFYRSTSRELKRLDSTSRSPLFAQFGETLSGIVTIRAYREQKRFSAVNQAHMDNNNRPYFQQIAAQRWLAVRLETVGNLLVLFAGLLGVISVHAGHSPEQFGLSMSYALQVTGVLNWCVRQAAEVETQMNSVERLDYYATELVNEAPPVIEETRPADSWPAKGNISIQDLDMAYRPGLPPVLRDVNLEISGGSKVGIVGRTGAGKSSIIVALLRLVEASKGRILIDDVDIAEIGLRDLRKRVSIIPQDPVLFAGTVRSNLDRFNAYSDSALWECLERAGLKDYVASLEQKLDAPVTENGENMSVGQRQLMCLARAMAVQARILIMDEATASVDLETDALIQKAIRNDFSTATIITIAHRLNTIIDYDRILVLDTGRVKEFDHPAVLLEREDSLLTALVNETGATNAELLRQLARDAQTGRGANIDLLLSVQGAKIDD
ncbi:hypothetical protein RI367_004618 [Sorochytrium milnesiophthora]